MNLVVKIFDAGHDRFRDGRGGGRQAGHHGQDGGRAHGHGRGHRVCFDDEEFDDFDQEEGSDENPFTNDGLHGWHHDHWWRADHEDEHHRVHCNREDLENITRLKLSTSKFTRRDDAYAYLVWAE